jgi:hypothetical protein
VDTEKKKDMFWDLAAPLMAKDGVLEGTMMGFKCLRVDGKFFTSLEKTTNNLIVKLPAARVNELVDAGEAIPFAPNGKVFREWAQIDKLDEPKWARYMNEALAFVREN